MKRALFALAPVALLAFAGIVLASAQEYALKDYMPGKTGSKWTMKTTGRQGDTTISYEIGQPRDFDGKSAQAIETKDADGSVTSTSFESLSDDAYTLFGTKSRFGGPGGQGGPGNGEPVEMLYDPPAVFPATMAVGSSKAATVKVKRPGGQETETTITLELAAVETVTVPKGTFDNCLKLVTTTTFGDRSMKRTAWYAPGVGLVKTERGGGPNRPARVAELTDYTLAD